MNRTMCGMYTYLQKILPHSFIQWLHYKKNKNSYSLHQLDNKLIKILKGKKNGYFVELGANDGIRQSNTLKLEKQYGWHGVLIEPALNNFITCLQNRSSQNHFSNVACVDDNYHEDYIELLYSDLMTVGKTSSLNISAHADKGIKHASIPQSFPFYARAQTLTEVLRDAKSPYSIDLLSLNVEGAELHVLQGIDFSLFNFNYILIECWELKKISNFLKSVGYQPIEQLSVHDWLFQPIS